MHNITLLYQIYLKHPKICTDTRLISENCIFFALKGENFDGNTFAEKALEMGAAYVVIDNPDFNKGESYFLVDDVLSALQELAKHHRNQLNIPVIGLTGSNGKTTTKELINAVLSQKFKTYATKGNLNNHIGVPLTLLSISNEVEIAIVEMGANHQKEIEQLCEIAQPGLGLITNVGMAHLEGFGGFEGVKKGKSELYAYLKTQSGIAFINKDNEHLVEMAEKHNLDNKVYYGKEASNYVSGYLKESNTFLEIEWIHNNRIYHASTHLTGKYNFENVLAAICIGTYFKLTPQEINQGLESYNPANNRSQVTKTERNTVICDYYNANPSSMTAALSNIKTLEASKKLIILGDMFELGPESATQHKNIIESALQSDAEQVVFIGSNFYAFKDAYKAAFFNNTADAADYLNKNHFKDFLVLLKGSRGMALERLFPLL
ncbi:UDP-N-acetylmuramoyl-tripeptide--D-alanyl-D-alanine ligase [Pedobacter montanisoli]|uniref:UDP-N-acetylmuramoyl-tripeptide--D-alanyl-D-alanine ligase n=1 Tax=Pedobacter montanisoli TaxID=2923277 RepID=A0ABS9ZTA2_9SPHI|nr:UDP-N-acetylmuramoyl-tripeptide--D-alanyl-D-alanine ligase [Pedobacter montanisoli]MCJ0741825.1 UDP-N-acetylmuramoyl-tripeptide--D-alanyl-D-alanine ligase [Pedobacter montanisoli]